MARSLARPRIIRQPPKGDSQPDMFVPDIQDLPLKDFGELMNAPLLYHGIYRGRQKAVTKMEYIGNSGSVTVEAPECGIATIKDYDLILFAITFVVDCVNQGMSYEKIGREFEVHPYTFLKFSRRSESVSQYDEVAKMLKRLRSTSITAVDLKNKNILNEKAKGWIDDYEYSRDKKTGKISMMKFKVSEWIIDAVKSHHNVLTLDNDYFLLTPQGRWIFRLMRKTAGNNKCGWRYSLDELYKLSGSTNSKRQWTSHFKKTLKEEENILGRNQRFVLGYMTTFLKDEKTGKEAFHYIHNEQLKKILQHFELRENNPDDFIDYEKVPISLSETTLIKPWLSNENFALLKAAKERQIKYRTR